MICFVPTSYRLCIVEEGRGVNYEEGLLIQKGIKSVYRYVGCLGGRLLVGVGDDVGDGDEWRR